MEGLAEQYLLSFNVERNAFFSRNAIWLTENTNLNTAVIFIPNKTSAKIMPGGTHPKQNHILSQR